MRFVPYEWLDGSPNIIVDGAAGQGTIFTLSHWPKSGTPTHFKRDTSAEIVFAYLDSPSSHVAADIVSNNHFDEDGLIGIFSLLNPSVAQKHRQLLIDVAGAGDFGVFRDRQAARIAFTISSHAEAETSPLPADLFALPYPAMAGALYVRLLALLPSFVTDIGAYKPLWQAEDQELSASETLIESGQITIEEKPALDLAIVRLPEGLGKCHPFALHSRTPCTRILLVQGKHVEFHYRYESWVQLASRRPPARIDLSKLALELNQEETSGGRWVFDGVERITPRLHLEGSATTSLPADTIQKGLEQHLSSGVPAWNPYD
jgi:hypothetical protein